MRKKNIFTDIMCEMTHVGELRVLFLIKITKMCWKRR